MGKSESRGESTTEQWRVAVVGQAETIASSLRAVAGKIEREVREATQTTNQSPPTLERLMERVKLQIDTGNERIDRQLAIMASALTYYREARRRA